MAYDAAGCLCASPAEQIAGGVRSWSPGRREDDMDIARAASANLDKVWCMSEVDIFQDLADREMDAIHAAAPMQKYAAGSLVYTPHQPLHALFILKMGRVRIFRVSADGRALTTAIIEPGTIFGQMVIVGQHMHDSFAEAIDDVVTCVMTEADVRRLLLSDPRIAVRISETLGQRLGALERRLSDTVFKSVPERIAAALATLAEGSSAHRLTRGVQIRLTHAQIGALAGSSRETTTKVLGELAAAGLIQLGRGRVTVLDLEGLRRQSGE